MQFDREHSKQVEDAIISIGEFCTRLNSILDSVCNGAKGVGSEVKDLPRYITRVQAAKLLQVSTRSIDRYIRLGKLQKKQLGASIRVLASDVEALVR